ncbi:flagellar biosynthetic protein FliR, partial [Escherichia coli]|uniref:flagellar biosynthetic protein FliR n=2 Tax=Escherichia coli TaxID=562 RepID=UPI001CF9AB7F
TGGTADRNRSHWSTSKTPSYTKSVSWQHHPLLVDTFHTLPIGGEPLNSNAFLALTKAGSLIFLNGLMLALPLITLLLTLNLALGLLNRMAPQLSIFVIGFPLTLTVGISLMAALMPLIAPFCEHLFSEIFNLLADIISELPVI